MKNNVPFLNPLIATLYLLLTAVILYCLKLATRPLKRFISHTSTTSNSQSSQKLNFNKLMALSWIKKYTLIGSLFESDKKYLLKQFVFISAYAVTCLRVNTMIFWPLAFSTFLVPCFFALFDILLKKTALFRVQEGLSSKNITVNHQASSQIQIESVNVQSRHVLSIDAKRNKQLAKLEYKSQRNNFEIIILVSLAFASAVMLLQTIFVLTNSLSNSGQLNILSLLVIISLDQFAVRISYGIVTLTTIKLMSLINLISIQNNTLVTGLCQEQITIIMIQSERIRQQKQKQITASPPKKKTDSPSKVPQALVNAQKSTLLNLINFQPTKRRQNSQIEQIYFTTQEKQMFQAEADASQNKSGILTKRRENRQTETVSYSAIANKHTKATIAIEQEKKGYDDIVILKDDPLQQNDQFFFQSPYKETRRRGTTKPKNKRNLKLTGNSPYLQYLPDMLKKVDKYKLSHRKDPKVL